MAIRKKFKEELAARHRSMAWVLFFALATAPVMFVAVAWAVILPAPGALTPIDGARSMPALFVPVLGAMAVAAAVAGIIVRRRATPERLAKSGLKTRGTPSAMAPDSDEERRLAAAVQRYQVALILSLALLESAAVFGFVLSFLSFDLTYVLGFSLVAVAIDILFLRPDPTIYERLARAVRT